MSAKINIISFMPLIYYPCVDIVNIADNIALQNKMLVKFIDFIVGHAKHVIFIFVFVFYVGFDFIFIFIFLSSAKCDGLNYIL